MTLRAPEELQRQYSRISAVLNWHIKAQHNRKRQGALCVECGMPYPCRTRLMLMGRETEAENTEPIKGLRH